ncbi:GNAT family N-acetyltransferase [Vagococcus sp. CY53-2]|uniref:GNAT family N-acetyltransferase n=1 Tax=Vagococcus sp. CY53-2 TaxID=2925780 RepID=UPI001F513ACA|nr:GNAT family N-acetyltransferase [Vagococcus sp. CY53-2]MCI0130538.1 GNAT family N-acetyltransferase [Vagococcus sp. CY53-2]
MDIYFKEKYGSLYESESQSSIENYKYQNAYGTIQYLFLKKKIPIMLSDEQSYYDISTPYGYGGPIIIDTQNKQALIDGFNTEFNKYCLDNNIVSEFIRFHPIKENALDFMRIYNPIKDRMTVGTCLKYKENFFAKEFSKSTRKRIRSILNNPDIRYTLEVSPCNLNDFITIYYSTMDRNNAGDFYYFDDDYFKKLLSNFKNDILLCKVYYKDKIIGSSLNLLSDNVIHVHLSGTDTKHLFLSPAYLIKYAVAEWGVENNYELVHYGGGKTNKDDDNLLAFKKKFSKNTSFDFYIGKKIRNRVIYEMLEKEVSSTDSSFFPSYRQN